MIEIAQTGQAGKTGLLLDMHRLRARVFKGMLGWDVHVSEDGLETDGFDTAEAVYLLALDNNRRVIGSWRMLSSTGPTMLRDIWPQCLDTLPMPTTDDVWEVSRFSVHSPIADPKDSAATVQRAIGEMFCALTELCITVGIREVYTFYDERIAKVIQRIDCQPERSSAPMTIDGAVCRAGAFRTDTTMLEKLRAATGIQGSCIAGIELPERMQQKVQQRERKHA